jgi:hypothetical protein
VRRRPQRGAQAGIDFVGLDASTSWMIAEVELDEKPEIGVRPEGGIGPSTGWRAGDPTASC